MRLLRRFFAHPGRKEWENTLSWLTPQLVAQEAGYSSRGMIYRLWESEEPGGAMEAFVADALDQFWDDVSRPDELDTMVEQLSLWGLRGGLLINALVGAEWQDITSRPRSDDWICQLGMAIHYRGSDNWHHYVNGLEVNVERLVTFYERAAKRLKLAPKPPLTWRQIALINMSIVDGMMVNWLGVPDAFNEVFESPFPEEVNVEVNLCQMAIRSVIDSLTYTPEP